MSAEITKMLLAMRDGDQGAFDRLVPLVYDHLKHLARLRLRGERADHTLNTTGLVHEAYMHLACIDRLDWQDRTHFFAVASRVMRRILINYAEKRRAYKRGGILRKTDLDAAQLISDDQAETVLELDDFLQQLEAIHPRQASVVEHRYFGGLSNEETAEVLSVSLRTVERDLRFARTWLARVWDEVPEL